MSRALWQDRDHRDLCRDGVMLVKTLRLNEQYEEARALGVAMLAMAK
jgi:hypothetical protein